MSQRDTDVHEVAREQMARSGRRYTANCRAVVDALGGAPQPLTVVEVLERATSVVQSSAYRSLALLERAGVVQRIVTTDDFARYELSQEISGHHHHMVCTECGNVADFELPEAFEDELDAVLREMARRGRFAPADHQLDVIGTCQDCPPG
ncbi:MAG: transcriptional repressor [Microthrixaceae bacterium]|nr:transcriptional repressor [Microthrixaceae bacterium]